MGIQLNEHQVLSRMLRAQDERIKEIRLEIEALKALNTLGRAATPRRRRRNSTPLWSFPGADTHVQGRHEILAKALNASAPFISVLERTIMTIREFERQASDRALIRMQAQRKEQIALADASRRLIERWGSSNPRSYRRNGSPFSADPSGYDYDAWNMTTPNTPLYRRR